MLNCRLFLWEGEKEEAPSLTEKQKRPCVRLHNHGRCVWTLFFVGLRCKFRGRRIRTADWSHPVQDGLGSVRDGALEYRGAEWVIGQNLYKAQPISPSNCSGNLASLSRSRAEVKKRLAIIAVPKSTNIGPICIVIKAQTIK